MGIDAANALAKVPLQITNPELIPAKRYYDAEFFELEREHLWPHVWQMACRLEELPKVGDYTVYDILDKSVIMIRTESGVKGFLNACRHRGVKLAHGPGKCGSDGFTCPFHGWKWNAEGENTFVFGERIFSPEIIEKAEINLVPIRTEEWAGCAFINFDNDAPSLRDSLGPVAQRMDARHVDRMKMDWWYATILPTNWKLAMEAFMESYHVMQTHRQLFDVTPDANAHYGANFGEGPVNEGLSGKDLANTWVDFHAVLSDGMGGSMVHQTEVAVLEGLRDMDLKPGMEGAGEWYMRAWHDIEEDARKRGADMFELARVQMEQPYNAVEYMFPHFFLLPVMGSAASYRIRPLTPETCRFEIWGLVLRPEGQEYDTPSEPTVLPYNSPDFPEIPRQDYSNLPIQQLGLHNIDYMRIGKGFQGGDSEGLISNYQRVLDGFLAGLDKETLRKAQNIVNCGFDSTILDVGFGPEVRKSEPAPVAEPEPAVA